MIKVQKGDLFESKSQTLVNTVNCEGIMGKGIALEFKKRFPDMYQDYVERCIRGEVKLGKPYLYKPRDLFQPWIINFPTKESWRSLTKLSDIITGLEFLLSNYHNWGVQSLAVPPLGCGLGQLEWQVVGPTLYRYLEKMEIPVELYAPYDTPFEELQIEFLVDSEKYQTSQNDVVNQKWIQASWIALVEILNRILEQPFHHPIGRTTFQKIAYIATEEGLPTGLHFEKGSYGPFSKDLKKLISRLINNDLIREERAGRMLKVLTGETFSDAQHSYNNDIEKWESIIEKVVDLFLRVDTRQAEIVATVVFAARKLNDEYGSLPTEKQVLDYILEWKIRRKPQLNMEEIGQTIRSLAALNWINVNASNDLPILECELCDV